MTFVVWTFSSITNKYKFPTRRSFQPRTVWKTLTFMDFPSQHWTRIRMNNTPERLNRKTKRQTRPIGAFPDGKSALMLVCARLRHVASSDWGIERYMNIRTLTPSYSQPLMAQDFSPPASCGNLHFIACMAELMNR